jgi:hypothetical protein
VTLAEAVKPGYKDGQAKLSQARAQLFKRDVPCVPPKEPEFRRGALQTAGNANPSIEIEPSMSASFINMDSESHHALYFFVFA